MWILIVLNILCGAAQAQFAAPVRPAPYMLPYTQNQMQQPMALGSWPQSSFPAPVYSFPQPTRWPMPIYSNYPGQYQPNFNPQMGGFGGMGGMGGFGGMGLNLNFDLSSLFSGFANSNSDFAAPVSEPYCASCEARRRRVERIDYSDDYQPAPRRNYVERSDSATEAGVIGVRSPAPIPYPETTQDDRVASNEPEAVPVTVRAAVRVQAQRSPRPPTRERGYVEEPFELSPAQQLVIHAINSEEREALTAPIWQAFLHDFQQCAPGCWPIQFAAFGHRDHATCHSKSEALDVHGMVCPTARGPMTFMAINRGAFQKMVMCMRTKMAKVLYFNGPDQTEGHQNHAHFSNGCIRNGHRMW